MTTIREYGEVEVPVRRSIEKLAWMLWVDPHPEGTTIGDLATRYGEPVDRIMDALDVSKIARGEISIIPPLDWNREQGSGR
jgi:hypothetical protein